MDKDTEKKIREAAAGKGDIMIVETDVPGCEVAAFRVPSTMEWSRYRIAQSGSKEERSAAARPLVACCCVYPAEPEVFAAALDAHPGLVETFANELVEHAGVGRAKKVSKL